MGRTNSGPWLIGVALALASWVAPAAANAQEPADADAETGAPSVGPLAAPPTPSAEEPGKRQRRLASQIDELIAGTLDPNVDPADLFREDLVTTEAIVTGSGLAGLFDPPPPPEKTKARRGRKRPPPAAIEPSAEPGTAARTSLDAARQRFLSMPPERQATILRAHADRRVAQEALARRDEERAALAGELQERARRIRDLVRGELDVTQDPAPLLVLDLSAPWVGDAVRAASIDDSQATDTDATPDAWIEAGREVLAALAEFRSRSGPERQALLDLHARRQADAAATAEAEAAVLVDASRQAQDEATRAAEERREALVQAEEAASQAARIGAQERARLLGIREAQALFEAELIRKTTAAHERQAEVARIEAEVTELARRVAWGEAPTSEADARWGEVRDALAQARRDFQRALRELDHPSEQVPEVGDGVDLAQVAEEDRAGLRELRDALRAVASRLRSASAEARFAQAETVSRQVATLNAARLLLLEHVGEPLRSRVTGFGVTGLEQVAGAMDQLRMQVQWRLRALPRATQEAKARFLQAPLDAVLALIYLAGLLVIFRWWRRNADAMLDRGSLHWETRRPATRFTHGVATGFWYLRRVRKPLEWLLLLVAIRLIAGEAARLPEARLLWMVLKWLLLAGMVVQGVDAVVERFTTRAGLDADERQAATELRRKSLRLVGLVVIVIGLTLGVIREVVGPGTLFAWVGKLTWLLVLPAIILLVRWWKPTVFERLRAWPRKPALADRILARPDGFQGNLGAAVGGAWLLGRGLYRYLLTLVGGASAYRKAHAYLFRREVQRQALLREQVEELPLLSGPAAAALAPDGTATPWVPGPIDAALDDVVAKVRRPAPHLIALVGERGLGKTAFLGALQLRVADPVNLGLSCPGDDFAGLLSRLAVALGLEENAGEAAIRSALIDRNPMLIAIDDCQRLVRPAIGGLEAMARLVELARGLPLRATWVLALESPAWHFLSRALAPQPMFDRVVTLPSWSEDRIADLLATRTTRTGITPRFDSLVHDAGAPPEALLGEEARTQRGFFRMLWDFSGGNPAVALHFWQTSLRQRPDGVVQVLLFDAPASEEVERMPLQVMFVLRALVQMERATAEALATATREPLHEVRDVLRFGTEAGWLVQDQGTYRLSWQWYRTITRVLSRQHLLVV